MKKRLTLKRTALALACICATNLTAIAQIGIGTTMPNANAALEVSSTAAENKGLLLPKVALTGTANTAPLTAHVEGMAIYNTATATDVTPGYYYNDGLKWIRIADVNNSDLRTATDFATSHITKDAGVGSNGTNAGANHVIAIGVGAGNAYAPFSPSGTEAGAIFIGFDAGAKTFGKQNTFIGHQSGVENTSGTQNVALGYQSLNANIGGEYNTAVGFESLLANTTGNQNVALGADAMEFNTEGGGNTAVGYEALRLNVIGSNNTAIGQDALRLNKADNNTAIGYEALDANNTGNDNTAIGHNSLTNNVSGVGNTAVGLGSLTDVRTGNFNIGIGYNGTIPAPEFLTVGRSFNTFLGSNIENIPLLVNNSVIIGSQVDATNIVDNTIIIADGAGTRRIVIDATGKIQAKNVNFSGLPVFSDEAAANASNVITPGTITTGDLYQTADGDVRIKM